LTRLHSISSTLFKSYLYLIFYLQVIGIIGFVVLKEYSIGKPIPPQYRFAPQEYHQPTDKHHHNTKLEGVAPAVLIGSVQ